MQARKSSEL